jgi:hypothetical protein
MYISKTCARRARESNGSTGATQAQKAFLGWAPDCAGVRRCSSVHTYDRGDGLEARRQVSAALDGTPIFDTVVAATIAVYVFIRNARDSLEPIRDYRELAAKVLMVSFVPDVLLAVLHGFGGGWPEAFALMAMHVAVWAICVTMLPLLTATGRT